MADWIFGCWAFKGLITRVAALLLTATDRSKFLTFCTNINEWLNLWDFWKAHETGPLPEWGRENQQTSAWRKHSPPPPRQPTPKLASCIRGQNWPFHTRSNLCPPTVVISSLGLTNQPSYWPPHNLHLKCGQEFQFAYSPCLKLLSVFIDSMAVLQKNFFPKAHTLQLPDFEGCQFCGRLQQVIAELFQLFLQLWVQFPATSAKELACRQPLGARCSAPTSWHWCKEWLQDHTSYWSHWPTRFCLHLMWSCLRRRVNDLTREGNRFYSLSLFCRFFCVNSCADWWHNAWLLFCWAKSPHLTSYLSELLHVYTPSRTLRSSSDTCMLEIQQYKRKTHGFRTFSCFGPHIWNLLPQDLRHCSTLSSFKAKLKTFLFSQYFHPN